MDFKGRVRLFQRVLQFAFSFDLVPVFGYQLKFVSIKCIVVFTIMRACFPLSVFLFVGVCVGVCMSLSVSMSVKLLERMVTLVFEFLVFVLSF